MDTIRIADFDVMAAFVKAATTPDDMKNTLGLLPSKADVNQFLRAMEKASDTKVPSSEDLTKKKESKKDHWNVGDKVRASCAMPKETMNDLRITDEDEGEVTGFNGDKDKCCEAS